MGRSGNYRREVEFEVRCKQEVMGSISLLRALLDLTFLDSDHMACDLAKSTTHYLNSFPYTLILLQY